MKTPTASGASVALRVGPHVHTIPVRGREAAEPTCAFEKRHFRADASYTAGYGIPLLRYFGLGRSITA
jgi:hypothetical protein